MLNFDLQPALKGELLSLRPLLESDFDALYAVASDPLIWEQHPKKDRYLEPAFRKFFAEAIESRGALAIIDAADGRIIGSSRYYELDPEGRHVVVGYTFLSRSCWGGAYNRELKRLMLEHAFRYVPSVLFHVDLDNMRSRKAMEKIGGRDAGRFTRPDGVRQAMIYSVDRPSAF